MWIGRVIVEAAELIVKAKRALDEVMGNSAWRRPMVFHGDGTERT